MLFTQRGWMRSSSESVRSRIYPTPLSTPFQVQCPTVICVNETTRRCASTHMLSAEEQLTQSPDWSRYLIPPRIQIISPLDRHTEFGI